MEDADYVRFATFLKHQADDDQYDAAFRARFDSERERSPEQVQVVQSIWRVNTLNRQLIDVVLARLEQSRPGFAVTRIFHDVAKHGIEMFHTLETPTRCDISGEVVEYPRQIKIRTEEERYWTIRSDMMHVVRFFNVVAHFVECTTARFRNVSESESNVVFEEHYRDWQCCRLWVTTLTDAIAALPKTTNAGVAAAGMPTPPATEQETGHHNEAMCVDT